MPTAVELSGGTSRLHVTPSLAPVPVATSLGGVIGCDVRAAQNPISLCGGMMPENSPH